MFGRNYGAWSSLCQVPGATRLLLLCCAPQLVKYYPGRQGKQPPRAFRPSQGQHHSDPWNLALVWAPLLPLLRASGSKGTASLFAQSERANADNSLEGASRGLLLTLHRKETVAFFPPSPSSFQIPMTLFLFFFFFLPQSKPTDRSVNNWLQEAAMTNSSGWNLSRSGSLGLQGEVIWMITRLLWLLLWRCYRGPQRHRRGALKPVTTWWSLGPQIEVCMLGKRCQVLESVLTDLDHTRHGVWIYPNVCLCA